MNTFNHTHPIDQHIPSILIVKDDLDDQMMLKIAFKQTAENISLHFVGSAKEALNYLQHTSDSMLPHLILIDFSLPGINGIKLKQELKTNDRYTDIEKVILSDSIYFHLAGSKQITPNHCLTKPDSYKGMIQLAGHLLQLCPQIMVQ